MSVKTFDFLKIQNNKLLVCEIRPVKCSIDTSAGRLKTTKWMNYQHWKELRFLLKIIADDYEKTRNNLKVTEEIKHGKPQTKISDSIKIAYMWAVNKECCRHFLTPRKDTCWSDSEDDPISLNDKGGRYNSLQACGDMLVVSVALLSENEIQHKRKRPKNITDPQSEKVITESAANSQHLDRSLIHALDPTLVSETPNISEYFSTQNVENKSPNIANIDESQKIKSRITSSTSRSSENARKSQLQKPDLQEEDIENRKKKKRSYFDTDSSSSTEVQLNPSSSTSSDSQTEAAASKIFNNTFKDTPTEIKGLSIKKESISNNVYSPPINTIDYAPKKSISLSLSFGESTQNKKSFVLENIKVERPDSPEDSEERRGVKNIQSSSSSYKTRPTPRISSPVDEIRSQTPEPYLKVGNSPTRTEMYIEDSIDLHADLMASNKLEIYPLDIGKIKDKSSTRKLRQHNQQIKYPTTESTSIDKNVSVSLLDSQKNNEIDKEYSNTSCKLITNYLRIQTENTQNSGVSSSVSKSIEKEPMNNETDMNEEPGTWKNTSLIKTTEMLKDRKSKKQRRTKYHNSQIDRISTKDLDINFTDGEIEEKDRNDRKDNSSHSLKHCEHQKSKYMKSLDSYEDREKAHIQFERAIVNECTDLIPHTTEELTDQKFYDFEPKESNCTSHNKSDSSKVSGAVVATCERVTKNTKISEETDATRAVITNKDQSNLARKRNKRMQNSNVIKDESLTQNYSRIKTRSKSTDVSEIAASSSPDMFDCNDDKTEDQTITSYMNNPQVKNKEDFKSTEDNSGEMISLKEDSGNIDEGNVVLSDTPEKLSSTAPELLNLKSSPIFRNRAIKRKNDHYQNSSLQHKSKRLKAGRPKGNTKIFDDETIEDTSAPVKDLAKKKEKRKPNSRT